MYPVSTTYINPGKLNLKHEPGLHNEIEERITLVSKEYAKKLFNIARRRLLNIGLWHQHGTLFNARFILADADGNSLHRIALKNDFIKVQLKNASAGPADWMQVCDMIYRAPNLDNEFVLLQLRPCPAPEDMAHRNVINWFDEQLTTTIILGREGNNLVIVFNGRTDKQNRMQWQSLLAAIIKPDEL